MQLSSPCCAVRFILKLKVVKFAVNTAALDQFRVLARFDNPALAQDDHEIGSLDRGQPVRDAESPVQLNSAIDFCCP